MNIYIYKRICKEHEIKENTKLNCLLSGLGGGIIGLLSQGLVDLYMYIFALDIEEACALMAISFIFVASLLTLFGIYKKLGYIFKAGLFLPTTGFANSIVSAAMEGRSEGFILGTGGNLFSLGGSVIVYGITSASFFIFLKFIFNIGGIRW